MAAPQNIPKIRPAPQPSMRDVAPAPRPKLRAAPPTPLRAQVRAAPPAGIRDIAPPGAPVEPISTDSSEISGEQSYRIGGDIAYRRAIIQEQLRRTLEQQHLRSLSEARSVQASISSVPAPNSMRYLVGKMFAILLDFVDILTTIGAISGVGWLVGVILDSAFGLFLLKWVSQGYATKGAQAQADIGGKIQGLSRRLTSYRDTAAKLARAGRRVASLRTRTRGAGRTSRGQTKGFNPMRRMALTIGLDSIPGVELLPMKYLLVRSIYKDHLRTYKESQLQSDSFIAAQREEAEQFAVQQQQQAEELYTASQESALA